MPPGTPGAVRRVFAGVANEEIRVTDRDPSVPAVERFEPGPRYSEAVAAGGLVFLAGQVPEDAEAGITQQAAEVLAAVDRALALAGSTRARLVSATIYLREMADYAAFNAVWDAWLLPHPAPARACVQALLADPRWRVEVQVVAAR